MPSPFRAFALVVSLIGLAVAPSIAPAQTAVPAASPAAAPVEASGAPSAAESALPSAAPALPTAGPLPTIPPGSNGITKTLGNGLRVVVVEDPAAPVVQSAMWYRFGSLYETPGKTGLAHALEHMMFRGTPSLNGPGLDDVAARLGAEMNADTSNDYTHFYFVVPADKLGLVLHIEADRMQHLLLNPADWNLERGAVLAEIERDYSDPSSKLYYAVRRAAWPTSPYGLTALGEKGDVEHATVADLRHYYQTWYAPNNATLVVTGDVKAADVFAEAARYFGSIPAKELPAKRPGPAPPAATGARVAVTADTPYTTIELAYQIPGDLQTGTAAAQILASVINNERSAFFPALIESGITLGYGAFADTQLRGGLLHVVFYVAPGHTVDEAVKAFRTTLATMRAQGVPPDLVNAAKRGSLSDTIYARDSITGLGDGVGYARGVETRSPAVDDALVAAVTPQAVDAALSAYVGTPNVIGVLTPSAPKPGSHAAPGSPTTSASDNFSARVPSGTPIEAAWVRAALTKPISISSRIHPTAFTLANGLRVVVQGIPSNPTVFVSGTIALNPRFDPPGKAGTGDLAATLLSYGSEKYDFQAQRAIADNLAASIDLGGSFGAHGFAQDLPTLLAVLADGEEHPTFPARYVNLIRTQTLSAIAKRAQNPDYLARRAFDRLLLPPGDPMLREPTEASIRAITVDDLRTFAATYFRPDLTTLSIVGDVDPQAVQQAVQDAFGSWANTGPKPDVALPAIPYPRPASTIVPANRDQVSVRLGQPAIARSNPDFYAFNLLNEVLGGGGGFDTRLVSAIRVKRGLVYSVSSSLRVSPYRGTLDFSLGASPSKVRTAVSVLRQQMRLLQQQPVAPDELARARTKLVAGALVAQQATDVVTGEIDNLQIYRLPLDYYSTFAQRYAAVTPAEVLAVAKRYLRPDGLVAVYEGPPF